MARAFKRRLYSKPGDFIADLRATLGRPRPMRAVMRGETIDLALHAIRIGNMAGNTFDYLLYRLSFGRCMVQREKLGL